MTTKPRPTTPPAPDEVAEAVAQAAVDAVRALHEVTTDLSDPRAVPGVGRHTMNMALMLSGVAEDLASVMARLAAQEETRTFYPGLGRGPETSTERAARKFFNAASKLLEVSLDLTTAQRDSTGLRDGAKGTTHPGRRLPRSPSEGPAL